MNRGFADLCLTTWLRRRALHWESALGRRKALKLAHLRATVNAAHSVIRRMLLRADVRSGKQAGSSLRRAYRTQKIMPLRA
jgi:hypothetical protein